MKSAVGPPTSLMYPLKSGSCVMAVASATSDSSLLAWMIRPWWKLSAQNEHSPRQPRLLESENLTSAIAGMPPAASYMGCAARA